MDGRRGVTGRTEKEKREENGGGLEVSLQISQGDDANGWN